MARIKIADVPQAPSVAGAAPQPINYPNLPANRVPYTESNLPGIPQVPSFSGSGARFQTAPEINPAIMENPLDLEGKIPQLMQTQMDSGPFEFLASQQMKVGAAISSAGRSVGDAIGDLGQALQQSKDMADISRANNFIRMGIAAYEEEAVNVPLSERQKIWEEKYQPGISGALGSLKMSPWVQDRVAPEWQLSQIKQRTEIATEARKEIVKQDEAAIQEELNSAVANGDFVKAADANARLTLGRHQTPQQQSARQKQINEAQTEWDVQQLINDNPRAALQEMEEAQAGKSDIFPDMKNPAAIANAKNAARSEVNRREVDASEAITEGMAAGSIKSKADIEAAAGGNLTPARIEVYNRMLLADPEYSSEAVVKARTAAEGYDPKTDPDLSKWHAIKEQIATTVPKSEQGVLNDALNSKREGKKGDKDPPQWYANSLLKEIEELTDNGYFDPPVKEKSRFLGIPVPGTGEAKYDRDKARKDPLYAIKHRDVEEAAWARAKTLQDSMRDWLIANEDASPKDARDQMNTMLSAENATSAAQAMKPKIPSKEAVPTAPATKSEGPPTSPPLSSKLPAAQPVATVTAYRPGGTAAMGVSSKVEGGPMDAHGNMILGKTTMEDYAAGRGSYVTVAMDKESEWQGKYLISEAYPGVVFKVMDNGGYGNGKTGEGWIDIAWTDPAKARNFLRRDMTFQPIDWRTAKQIAAQRT